MAKRSTSDVPNLGAMDEFRVVVCGGRGFGDRAALDRALDALHKAHSISVLIHGNAHGADTLAREWAKQRGVPVRAYSADWEAHGRAAGPIRNERILMEGRPDFVIAFPGLHGTSHMIRLARRAGVPVWKPIPFDEMPPKKWEQRGLSEPCQSYVHRSNLRTSSAFPGYTAFSVIQPISLH